MPGKFHWVPDYTLEENRGYNTDIHTFESGKEQGRLKQSQVKSSFTLVFNNISKTQIDDMLKFFQLQHGAELSFTWIDPTTNTSYTVRFASDDFTYERAANDVYNIKLQFQQIV